MESTRRLRLFCRRVAQALGILVVLTGSATLAGWATGHPVLLGVRATYIPMAPNTGLGFIVLGSSLIAVVSGGGWGHRFAALGGCLVGLVGVLRLGEFASVFGFAVDHWFIPVPGKRFGLAPLGMMSLASAFAFVTASVAVVILAWSTGTAGRHPLLGHMAGVCGLGTAMTGLVFSLGYLFSPDSPLLYGTESIPMALNTSCCFVTLGVGLAMAAGPGAFPLSRLCGTSIRARLLRTFLPLVVGTVGVVAWITYLVTTSVGASSAAISSAALVTLAIALFGVICEQMADRVGGQIDRAEAGLRQAHDLLEVKVEERTGELSRINVELARSLRETRLAHESLQQAHLELKQAQSRMLQQAKLASLGQTAAGVAHEINNPLAFVTNNMVVLNREVHGLHDIIRLYQQAEQTMAQYQPNLHARISSLAEEVDLTYILENLDDLLERSRGGLLRIQKIVADLRDFAHLEEAEFKEADLNASISTMVRLMQNFADRHQVTLETNLRDIPKPTCCPTKINMVVQCLISNAIDACGPGGKVMVETRPIHAGIEILVSDNGCGIVESIRDRVFDPFFTTKPVGQGTGLGLAIGYGIMKDHGGSLDFESTPGQGTRFRVYLPLIPSDEALVQRDGAVVGDFN